MKFKFDPRAGRMVGSKTQILQRYEIERLGGVIPDNRHISPGTAYIPEKEVIRVKSAARRDGVEVTRLNGYDKDIGGGLYRFEKTTTFESRKNMKPKNIVKEEFDTEDEGEWATPNSDFRCCWCGEPVDMDTAHNVGHDIYCDDCFRERFYSNRDDESVTITEEFDTEDGWDCDEIRDSGLLDTLRKCANLHYTLDKCTRASANFGETLGDLKAYVNELAEELQNEVADFPEEEEVNEGGLGDRAFVSQEDVDELVLYITNDSQLYHRWVQPIIANLRKKVKKGIYNPDLAIKLWKVLADEGARKYDKEFNDGKGRVDWLNVKTRLAIAKELRDHYQEQVDDVGDDAIEVTDSNDSKVYEAFDFEYCNGCGEKVPVNAIHWGPDGEAYCSRCYSDLPFDSDDGCYEAREPFGDFDYPEWMDDVEYRFSQGPDIVSAFEDVGWSIGREHMDSEKDFMATSPSGHTNIAFHFGDKIMDVMTKVLSSARKHHQDEKDIETAFEEVKAALEAYAVPLFERKRSVKEAIPRSLKEIDPAKAEKLIAKHTKDGSGEWEGSPEYSDFIYQTPDGRYFMLRKGFGNKWEHGKVSM